MFVTMAELLNKAQAGGYAVAAPSVRDETSLMASVHAAEELNAPVIININGKARPDMGFVASMVHYLALRSPVPMALNQDHGSTYEQAMEAIHAGYSSVMADRSTLPFEDNVAQVAEIAKVAHACGVSVEGELGYVGYGHLGDEAGDALTDPDKAAEYVERTGVDCLAISIGTIHGSYKGEPHIDFELLAKLKKAVSVPLVLHGGSGTGDDNLARACREGICKINVGTDVMQKGRDAIMAKEPPAPHFTLTQFYEGYKQELKRYMTIFGSAGKANA